MSDRQGATIKLTRGVENEDNVLARLKIENAQQSEWFEALNNQEGLPGTAQDLSINGCSPPGHFLQ
eukprot:3575714-Pyramimonas_sp.AAC.1